MVALPPFLLVFDISALLAGKTRDWQEFSRLGECYVPKAVLEEMQFLCDRAPEPSQEVTAREFTRFYPTSGWKETFSIASHPSLEPAEGHTLSKKARLALSVAQTAYGLAKHRPDGLVVLIANDQPLLQRIITLKTHNLCGIPLTALVQWSRSLRKPPVVAQHLQSLRTTVGAGQTTPRKATSAATVSVPARPTVTKPTPPQSRSRSFRPAKTFYNLLTLLILLTVAAGSWRFVHPVSFSQVWRQLGLPELSTPSRR